MDKCQTWLCVDKNVLNQAYQFPTNRSDFGFHPGQKWPFKDHGQTKPFSILICFYEIHWKWLSNGESVENVVVWLDTGQFWPKIQNPLQNKAIIKFLKNQKNSKKDFIQFAKLWMHVLDFIWSTSIYSQILDPQGCLFNIIP